MPRILLRLSLAIVPSVALLALILLSPQIAEAGGAVTDCSDDTDLHANLAGGGLVTFNCGSAPVTITLTTLDLPGSHILITQTTTISGGGLITLRGSGAARIFNVTGSSLTIEGLGITGGRAPAPALDPNGNDRGGAISVRNNSALTIADSVFFDNRAQYIGGALYVADSVLTVRNSHFYDNQARFGGAMYLEDTSAAEFPIGQATIVNSAIISNTATNGDGGGIRSVDVRLNLANSTLSNNRAIEVEGVFGSGDGGAIAAGGNASNISNFVVLTNTTVYSNFASVYGGGIRLDSGSGTGSIKNSIIAHNSATTGTNCSSLDLVSLGNNLDSGNSCNFIASGDLINTDPLLGPLADNGGGTLTHAPLPGSPAVNAADNSACAAPPVNNVDQRGVSRPQGTTCDMGAVEATANLTLTKSSTSDRGDPVQPTEHVTYTIVVTNTGGLTATNALISDATPANTTFVPGSISLTPSSAGTPGVSPPILASDLFIAPNQPVAVSFAVTVNAPLPDGTLITNTASVTSTETPGPVSDSVTDTVIATPILSIGKSSQDVNSGVLVPGDTIMYTVVVTNSGADATNGVISDTLPANTTFVPGSISLTPPGAGTVGLAPPILADDLTFYANEAVSVAFAATVNKPLNAGTIITNTASVTSSQTPLPLTDSVTNTVSTTPAINVAKEGPPGASVDETVVYTFTVTNVGDTLLENVQVVDDYAGPAHYVGGDDGDLKLGLAEAWVYTAAYTIQSSDPDPLINTVSVTATDALNTQAAATDQHSTRLSGSIYLPLILKVFGP